MRRWRRRAIGPRSRPHARPAGAAAAGTGDVGECLHRFGALRRTERAAIVAAADGRVLYAGVAARLVAAGRRDALFAAGPPAGLDGLYDWALADVGAPYSLPR